ncbi:MAG: tRNA pseudouridine(55) synthase TruB [Alphaproteobacteria bacterium]|nr:tRNA pseudouridine(55) synthase TruB [Alphaproteobacteria bacterium]MCB9928895.1 tRNA pseudouridine(55) synthase TruB [Alphaproteobacteria bacterium]
MAGRRRKQKSHVNGWLIVDKPSGITSTGVCNVVKRLAKGAKTGHGGTLDPLATGVLPIAFGEATKTVPYVMDGRKIYRFAVRWGEARDTDDAEGQVTATSEVRPDQAAIEAVLPRFVGEVEQVPPAYSAIKVGGQRAYDLARENQAVELAARVVEIDRLELESIPDADHAVFLAECGKGTYMRSLARDIALALGTVGHVTALRRIAVGPFHEDTAHPLAKFEAVGHIDQDSPELLPVETALADIPALAVSGSEAAGLRQGRPVALFRRSDLDRVADFEDGDILRAVCDGVTVALVRLEEGQAQPMRIIHQPRRKDIAAGTTMEGQDDVDHA